MSYFVASILYKKVRMPSEQLDNSKQLNKFNNKQVKLNSNFFICNPIVFQNFIFLMSPQRQLSVNPNVI
jgi:hypothetical protein